jgi:hypothetical protein
LGAETLVNSLIFLELRTVQLQKYTKQTSDAIAITSHGVPIGYDIPTQPTPQQQDFLDLQEAAQKIRQLLETKGITEDDLLADFQNAQKSSP